eukprot:1148892-Pelagomonas_calceolata.AAC.6
MSTKDDFANVLLRTQLLHSCKWDIFQGECMTCAGCKQAVGSVPEDLIPEKGPRLPAGMKQMIIDHDVAQAARVPGFRPPCNPSVITRVGRRGSC